jgi:amino acid transporter
MNALTGADLPWNSLAATFAPWMKWFVIIGSVSSMFAVMINSNNGIVRILNTMGRERLLPVSLGRIDAKRLTPSRAVAYEAVFALIAAIVVGIFAGGLGNPTAGFNVYGYFGFALTLSILPVYALANIAVIVYFRKRTDFNLLRHLVLPVLGGLLMIGLLIGQIIENPSPPYNWMPWALLGWLVVLVGGAIWLGRSRPQVLARAGAVMATGEVAEELALHGAPED